MYHYWKLFSIVLFLNFSYLTNAETVFVDSIGTAECYEEAYSLIPFKDGYLCTAAQLCTTGTNTWENRWFFLDDSGDSNSLINNSYSGFAKLLSNGDFIVYGGEAAGLTSDSVFIHRFNSQGQWLWSKKSYFGSCNNTLNSITEDSEGNLYACGVYSYTGCSSPMYNSFVLKLNANGGLIWSKSISYGNELQLHDIEEIDQELYLVGFSDSSGQNNKVYYSKLDESGNLIWRKTIEKQGAELFGFGLAKLNNQIYILAYDDSVRLFTCDALGNFQSQKSLGSACGSRYFHIDKSLDGYLLILAYKRINSVCSSTFSKMDSSGKLIWEKNFGGLLRSYSEIDSGAFLFAGYENYLPKAKVLRFDTTFTSRPPAYIGIEELESNSLKVYPNPSSGVFSIEHNSSISQGNLHLFNLQGKLVSVWNFTGNKTDFSLAENLSNGIYTLKLNSGEINHTSKIVLLR